MAKALQGHTAKKTVGSLCSGIEAASAAWEPLGYEFKWFSEIAPFPSRLLAEKYPNVLNLGDMTGIGQAIMSGAAPATDVICGGTPCQAFSYAGWQKGLKDDRGNLTLKFVDIVNANDDVRQKHSKGPALVLWENVEGVLSDKTNAFGCFISSLAGLPGVLSASGRWPSAGFVRGPRRTIAWRVLDAKYFGIPQQRRRLYVIAGNDSAHPEAILFEKHATPEYVIRDSNTNGIKFSKDGHDFEIFRSYTDCLYSSYATKWNGNAAANNGSLFVVQDGRIRRLSPLECERLMGFPDNYTKISGSKKSNRYQALGNSWAVPVVRWIGERMFPEKQNETVNWFPVQPENDFEYRDLSNGFIDIGSGVILNCSDKPEKQIAGSMKDVVSPNDIPDIYLSPVGCAGILRRKSERGLTMNARLEEVMASYAQTMSADDIKRKSMVQKRGKFSNTGGRRYSAISI
jgi:DNA (cytosine-5)-methyltransferase 1